MSRLLAVALALLMPFAKGAPQEAPKLLVDDDCQAFAFDASGKDKVFLKVRDVLKKYFFVTHGNMIKEHKVLVNLAHIADVWHHRHSEFTRQQAHGEEFAHSANPRAIHLDKTRAAALQIALEDHPIGDVLAHG